MPASLPVWTRQYHAHYFDYRLHPAAERPECPEAPDHSEAANGTDR